MEHGRPDGAPEAKYSLAPVATRLSELLEAPVAFDENLRPGLAFMNLHFPDLVETNVLTIDATDPKSGTAELSVRVMPEPL